MVYVVVTTEQLTAIHVGCPGLVPSLVSEDGVVGGAVGAEGDGVGDGVEVIVSMTFSLGAPAVDDRSGRFAVSVG